METYKIEIITTQNKIFSADRNSGSFTIDSEYNAKEINQKIYELVKAQLINKEE